MKAKFSVLAGCALALMLSAPSHAEQASQAQKTEDREGQAMPRAKITTPLGRQTSQILMYKITVSDMPKSYEFYTKIVGLQMAKTAAGQTNGFVPTGSDPKAWPGELALNFSGSLGDEFFDLIPPRKGMLTREQAGLIVLGIKVADAAAVIKRAKDAGYDVVREAAPANPGPGEMSIGMIHDPDGYLVEIVQAANYPRGE